MKTGLENVTEDGDWELGKEADLTSFTTQSTGFSLFPKSKAPRSLTWLTHQFTNMKTESGRLSSLQGKKQTAKHKAFTITN